MRLVGHIEPEPAPEEGGIAQLVAGSPNDDDALAESLQSLMRRRRESGDPLELRQILDQAPSVRTSAPVLDAVLEMALTDLMAHGHGAGEAIETLVGSYPELEREIRVAGAISEIFDSRALDASFEPSIPLPARFGPLADDGYERFELRELLGSGLSGDVYRAVDRNIETEHDGSGEVALKILALREFSESDRRLLAEEGRRARAVQHPSVVTIHERGRAPDDREFVVMELASRGSLASLLEREPALDARRAAALIAQVGDGLAAAHTCGLIHGDLKPDNVLLFDGPEADRPRAKLADFGLAFWDGADRLGSLRRLSQSTGPIGNLALMAPEVRAGALATVHSDLFSLAAMLRYTIDGSLPGDAGQRETPRPPLPGRLDAIIERSLSDDPSERHASAAEFADDLRRWLLGRAIPWLDRSPLGRLGLWIRRSPLQAAAIAAITAGVVIGSVATADRIVMERNKNRLRAALEQIRADQIGRLGEEESINNTLPALLALELLLFERPLAGSIEELTTPELMAEILELELERVEPGSLAALLLRFQRAVSLTLPYDAEVDVTAEAAAIERELAAMLDPGDPLLDDARVFSAVATLKRAYADEKRGIAPDRGVLAGSLPRCLERVRRAGFGGAGHVVSEGRSPITRLAVWGALYATNENRLDDERLFAELESWRLGSYGRR
ncbi:MAG: serine/threonine-protein kinase [Planctomycetota bacterium]